MKNVFIINPVAGKKDISKELIQKICEVDETAIIHVTSGLLDATVFVEELCANNKEEYFNVFACGGDGTLNEVVNGAVNFDNISVGSFPCGSGNDFLKNFKERDFLDLNKQIKGKIIEVDLFKYNDHFGINICNLGFDANVAYDMLKFKKKPFISGKMAYNLAVFYSLLRKMKYRVKISLDDKEFFSGDILLSTIANGICYGGGYYCTPLAIVDDGLLDVCVAKKISRFKLLKLIKSYKKGKHIRNEKFKNIIFYEKVRKVNIESEEKISFCVDGEVYQTNSLTVEIVPKKIKFILPEE